MKAFNDKDFMLDNEVAVKLYNDYADVTKVPVIDYHCHIPVSEIREDKRFKNITEIWLGADHYKWRQMRVNGIPERLITGDGDDYEKFMAFASIMPRLIGNPLYHWSHMELATYFDIHEPLNTKTAPKIWEECNKRIASEGFSARNLIKQSNVRLLCTTDDPIDDLKDHIAIAEDENFDVQVLPAFRPDNAVDIEKASFSDYIKKLAQAANMEIDSIKALKAALVIRMDHFEKRGCKVSDHGLYDVRYMECSEETADAILKKALSGEQPTAEEVFKYKTNMLIFFAKEYVKYNWVMQLHYGVTRDKNSKMFAAVGPNTGFDCLHNDTSAMDLMAMLDAMESREALPKTILYSLNPIDNAAIDCVIGCFAKEGVRGKLQHGSAWWFNDHAMGMREQLSSYASMSTLGNHIGMLTDSRSFLSYTRHEYFRRIMCNMVGTWVNDGKYPCDYEALGEIVRGISLDNALEFFGFEI